MSTTDAVAALKQASSGLLYQSESDAPFTPFTWKMADGELTKDKLLKRARKPANTPVEEVPVDDFFKDLTTPQDWWGDEEKATAARYQDLLKVIKKNLSNVKVFKVGRRQVSVFLVGNTDDGDWVGLKTSAVET